MVGYLLPGPGEMVLGDVAVCTYIGRKTERRETQQHYLQQFALTWKHSYRQLRHGWTMGPTKHNLEDVYLLCYLNFQLR